MAHSQRHRNRGLRKVCGCARRTWPKCSHSWYFNFKPRGGKAFRFSVDAEAGEHIEGKTKADAMAETWRTQIRTGTFLRRADAPPVVATPAAGLTLSEFGERYTERLGRPVSANARTCFQQWAATPIAGVPFGQRVLASITEDDLEVFFAGLRTQGKAASTRNKYVQVVKAMCRWAVKKGYLSRDPAADSDAIRREKHAQRDRRLEPGEETALLEHAGPHLQRLIVAALETGCRKGELLGLTWRDCDLTRREITLRAEATKTRTGRVVPVSARLAAVLAMATTDPAGQTHPPEARVFGDAAGQPVKDIKKAWETAVLKAHGHAPTWTRNNSLAPTSRAVFASINLTFHDLRHEAGSRLLEAGWPIHSVAHMLGHANISQTSTYLNATRVGLQDAMRRLDASRCNSVAQAVATDRAPLGNDGQQGTEQVTVN